MKKILFVCSENSNRSQVAEAFAKIYGTGKVIAFSAGSSPSGIINPKAIESMGELGYDLTSHSSKSVDSLKHETFDAVITMGCGDDCPFIPAKMREDWNVPDPRNMTPDQFGKVRDQIAERVKQLLRTLDSIT